MNIRERAEVPGIDKLAEALAKAQGKFKNAEKNRTNQDIRFKYADLGALLDAIREPLSENGLAVFQSVRMTEIGVACDTILMHASGQWMDSTLELPLTMREHPQAIGSAITYARRYSLSAAVGISSGDDDDGAKASEGAPPAAAEPTPEKPIVIDASFLTDFSEAKTVPEVMKVWQRIPTGQRKLYVSAKDEAKARVSKGGA